MKLRPTQITYQGNPNKGRWKIEKWDSDTYRWIKCPHTGTFATKSNAVVGMNRHKSKYGDGNFGQARHDILASNPFCAGVEL